MEARLEARRPSRRSPTTVARMESSEGSEAQKGKCSQVLLRSLGQIEWLVMFNENDVSSTQSKFPSLS